MMRIINLRRNLVKNCRFDEPFTRHRAAIGLSEQCDALIVVVSEETCTISVAEGGHLTRCFDEQTLAAKIRPAFAHKKDSLSDRFLALWRNKK